MTGFLIKYFRPLGMPPSVITGWFDRVIQTFGGSAFGHHALSRQKTLASYQARIQAVVRHQIAVRAAFLSAPVGERNHQIGVTDR